MAPSLRLNHMSLLVRDVHASAEFYQRVLQLPEIESLAGSPSIRWFGIGPDQAVHLIEGEFANTQVTRTTHFCITTPKLEETVSYIERTGTPYCDYAGAPGRINTRADGVHSIYIQDPDGYWIEVSEEF